MRLSLNCALIIIAMNLSGCKSLDTKNNSCDFIYITSLNSEAFSRLSVTDVIECGIELRLPRVYHNDFFEKFNTLVFPQKNNPISSLKHLDVRVVFLIKNQIVGFDSSGDHYIIDGIVYNSTMEMKDFFKSYIVELNSTVFEK